jgi:hypothetical protein
LNDLPGFAALRFTNFVFQFHASCECLSEDWFEYGL